MDKAHAAAELSSAARKHAHKTVALAQAASAAQVATKSTAELKVEADRAFKTYIHGMKKEVKNERALIKETKYAESAVEKLSIPDSEKAAAARALEEVQAIERKEVVATKQAVKQAKKLRR